MSKIYEKNNTGELWKVINQNRQIREVTDNNITIDAWYEHFVKLLDGKEVEEARKTKDKYGNLQMDERDKESDISMKEVEEVLRRLMKKKATGLDGIENEVWIYSNADATDRNNK